MLLSEKEAFALSVYTGKYFMDIDRFYSILGEYVDVRHKYEPVEFTSLPKELQTAVLIEINRLKPSRFKHRLDSEEE